MQISCIIKIAFQLSFSVPLRLLDPSGAPIESAAVSIVRYAPQPQFSGPEGNLTLSLPPGRYTLHIVKEGFLETDRQIVVSPVPAPELDIILQVAPVKTALTVTESSGYLSGATASGTKTLTPLRDVPQSISVVTGEQIRDQSMLSIADVVRYIPGITAIQGENNRDQLVIRGNSTSADFFLNGVRDDVQYYRDLYNLDRVEALKGPNALIFGRGGAGGVINRVSKEPLASPLREVTLQGGSFSNKRAAADFDQRLRANVDFRLNAVYENSGSFRRFVNLQRYGINPSIAYTPGPHTRLALAYEHFGDRRTADRGLPTFLDPETFFGNPNDSRVRAAVNLAHLSIDHQAGALNVRNRTQFGAYDRFYQNYVPGAGTLSAYNNATQRFNFFNQTDLNYTTRTGPIRHNLLAGIEAGRQLTDNFRNTGYFNNTNTTVPLDLANPVVHTPISFRQSATDANNHIQTNLGAAYLQDQIELTRRLQFVAGLRIDHFDLRFHNNRTAADLRRIDNLLSPRFGVVFKPLQPVSFYGSFSVSYLPSSGDQFSSLTVITQQVKPEKFTNYEFGMKWDFTRSLAFTAAVYRLERTNTRSTDPNDATRIVQTGSQRTNGFETGLTGSFTRKWRVSGGYTWQDAYVSRATVSARAGAQVAQVPHHTFSFWNNYQFARRLGAGLGIVNRTDMFAAIDNTILLPGYTRADAALFVPLTEKLRLQANVENLTNRRYYLNADNNTNISPGSPRAFRLSLTARF